MTGTPFAGQQFGRRGCVLVIAAQGASEIPIRLRGVVGHKFAARCIGGRLAERRSGQTGHPLGRTGRSLVFASSSSNSGQDLSGRTNVPSHSSKNATEIVTMRFACSATVFGAWCRVAMARRATCELVVRRYPPSDNSFF